MDALRTLRAAACGPIALATAAFALAGAASTGGAADSDTLVCTGGLAIGFSIDGSGSIRQRNFNALTEQVASFINTTSGVSDDMLNDNVYYVNVWNETLVETTGSFAMNDDGAVSKAVEDLSFPRGFTNISAGLMDLTEEFKDLLAVEEKTSIAIVFTDGKSNRGNATQAAQELRELGVTVAAVGIGNSVDQGELESIASEGLNDTKLVFSIARNDVDALRDLLDVVIESIDSDGDGINDCEDGCPGDPEKTEPEVCGCGEPETCKKAKLLKFKKFAKYGPGKHFAGGHGKHFVGGHKKIVVKKSPPRSHRFSKFHNRSHRGSKYSAW